MVMTFVLHPLSHNNSITEPRARFLLHLIKDLTIDFPYHFILSLTDVYKDTVTHNKLIFPSAIMRIIPNASVSYLEFAYFTIMGAISSESIRWSKAQIRPKWPQSEIATPPASFAPSTVAPSSVGGVTFKAIMAQLEHMDARLDTLSDELCQVNTHAGRITPRQAIIGVFNVSPSPSPQASKDERNDNGSNDDDADEDDGVSSSGDEEMTTSQ